MTTQKTQVALKLLRLLSPVTDMLTNMPAVETATVTVVDGVSSRRSRAGRFLRPVTRLIEIMQQSPALAF